MAPAALTAALLLAGGLAARRTLRPTADPGPPAGVDSAVAEDAWSGQ